MQQLLQFCQIVDVRSHLSLGNLLFASGCQQLCHIVDVTLFLSLRILLTAAAGALLPHWEWEAASVCR